jgi:hypothetical protein
MRSFGEGKQATTTTDDDLAVPLLLVAALFS